MPSSVTLVDANVVINTHAQEVFRALLDGNQLAVCPAVMREAVYFMGSAGWTPIALMPYVKSGRLQLLEATLAELQHFVRGCPRSGLGAGETESLAIVQARSMSFCTGDRHAMRVMQLLGLGSLWRSLEQLYASAALDPSPLDLQWRTTAWPGT